MSTPDKKNRSHLPMPNTSRPALITYDAKDPDTKMTPIEQLRPPKGAPNVLIVLLDPGRAIDALQLRIAVIAAPVGTGNRKQLECLDP